MQGWVDPMLCESEPGGNWTRDLQIASPMPCRHATLTLNASNTPFVRILLMNEDFDFDVNTLSLLQFFDAGSVLFFSRPWSEVGHTMDVLSPFISVLCHSDWLYHGESCPRIDVLHPGRAWSSSPACTWRCSLHYLFLQATPLFPHSVTIVW